MLTFDRWSLVDSMFNRVGIEVLPGVKLIVNELMAEDGSGWNWIVTGQWIGRSVNRTFFVGFKSNRVIELKK